MKVLQIGYSYKFAAQGEITHQINSKLIKEGIETFTLFAEQGTKSEKNAKQCNPNVFSILTRGLNFLFGRNEVHGSLQSLLAIYWINRYKPDLIQVHVIHHNWFNYKLLFKYFSILNIPIVFTLHDMWMVTGGCYHYFDTGCRGYKTQCKHCPGRTNMDCGVKKTHNNFLYKKNYVVNNNNIYFIAVSEWVKKETDDTFLKNSKIEVIRNGIDTGSFCKKNTMQIKEEKFRIIGVANSWSKEKGIDDFYKLAEMLGNKFEILLVGGTNYIDMQHAPTNIKFLGKVESKEKLIDLYNSANAFVHLSKCETYGMVIAEAACCGLPVYGYNSTGIAEVIKMAKGELIELNDLETLVSKLNQLKNTYQVPTRSREFLRKFSIDDMAEKYYKFYLKVINEKK